LTATLEWLGTATFRLKIDGLTIFLDAYMDRVPAALPVGLSTGEVTEADFVLVGHSHFDHLAGAEVIAKNTGATIIGSHESCRVMREHGVPDGQLIASSGGERHGLAPGVTVRVFPSMHACTWVLTDAPSGQEERGHTGLTEAERAQQPGLVQRIMDLIASGTDESKAIYEHVRNAAGSLSDGGPLVYLIETPSGRIFYQDTSGCWTGVLSAMEADAAVLAASGRANVDGEPVQGSIAGFLAMEARLLGARRVVLGHHDNWMPPVTVPDFDMAPVREALKREAPDAAFLEPAYLAPVELL